MIKRFIKGIPYEPDNNMPSEEEQEDEEDEVWIEKSLWQELDIPPKAFISEGPASDSNKDSSNKDSEQMKESE